MPKSQLAAAPALPLCALLGIDFDCMRTLIVRFSSFGDIFQALEAARHIKAQSPDAVGWLVRSDFAELLTKQDLIDTVHRLDRTSSPLQLIALAWHLAEAYDRVYDAHANLRSFLVRWTVRVRWLLTGKLGRRVLVRPKHRLRRLLFFRFRLNTLPVPFRGAESYVAPLQAWFSAARKNRFDAVAWQPPTDSSSAAESEFARWKSANPGPVVALAPSAAWPNKRWPVARWADLVRLVLQTKPATRFLLLGGPDDRFLDAIETEFGHETIYNAVAKTSLLESSLLLSHADALVANDTGLLHVADRLQKPHVAIIGPTAFGYTASPCGRTAEVDRRFLLCKPCSKDGRDPCRNPENLKCLVDVHADDVARLLSAAMESR